MILSNIDYILIRAKLSNKQTMSVISSFSIEYALNSDDSSGSQELASAIEVCNCPVGYTGTSCELCSSGYQRVRDGFFWGICEWCGYF